MFTSVSYYKKFNIYVLSFVYFFTILFSVFFFPREKSVVPFLRTKQKVLIFKESRDTFLTHVFGIARRRKRRKIPVPLLKDLYRHYGVCLDVNGYCYTMYTTRYSPEKKY